MVHQEKLDSNALRSDGTSSTFPRIPFKRPKTAKVKFLELEEAIKLSSETRVPTTFIHHNPLFPTDPSDFIPERTKAKTTTSNCLPTGNTRCTSTALQQQVHMPNDANCNFGLHHGTSVRSMKTAGLEDRHSKPVASTVNCKLISCSTLSEKDVKSCEPELPSNLKEEQPSGKDDGTSKEAQLRVTRDEGAVAAKTLSILQKFHGNCPAMENIWNGNLEILHSALSGGNYEGILRHFRLYEGFSAHPPARVSRRAYEFSKKLTGVLEFKFHPIQDQWPKTFQSKLPDGNDIGLYFYAQKSERSKKHYSILLKFIEKNYLMMKSSIEDVELLVFPSKVLAADCQRLDEGSLFMWGVFRHLKCNTIY